MRRPTSVRSRVVPTDPEDRGDFTDYNLIESINLNRCDIDTLIADSVALDGPSFVRLVLGSFDSV